MIGIGTDILEIERLNQAMIRSRGEIIKRILTPQEQEIAAQKGRAATGYYAGRWTAKEAVAKMLGTGIGKDCSFQDITILNNEKGAPYVTLAGAAKQKADSLGITRIHISISHEQHYCIATVIGE
jgi:holo-[acyl-carrier protein] synthase